MKSEYILSEYMSKQITHNLIDQGLLFLCYKKSKIQKKPPIGGFLCLRNICLK